MNGDPDGMGELHFIPECIVEFYVGVTRCPDRGVTGTLNNRGHDDWPEITCWPKKVYHARTSGKEFKALGFSPEQPRLNDHEKQICAILDLQEWELATFLRNWTPTRYNEPYPDTVDEMKRQLAGAGVQWRPKKK